MFDRAGERLPGHPAHFAGKNSGKSIHLFWARFVVHEEDHVPVAFMNGLRIFGGNNGAHALQGYVAELAILHFIANDKFA